MFMVIGAHIVCEGVSLVAEDLVYIDAIAGPLVALTALYRLVWDQRHVVIPLLYILWGARLGAFICYRRTLLGKKGAKCIITDVASITFFTFIRICWTTSMVATLYVVPHRSRVVRFELGVLALTCVLIQHLADCQLTLWRIGNKRDQYREGLFKYSRCPNLVAELGFHFFTGLAVSPHSMFGLLAFLTSLVLITLIPSNTLHCRTERARERWGHQSTFQTYVDNTPMLMSTMTAYNLVKESTLAYWRLARPDTSLELLRICTFSFAPTTVLPEQTLPVSVRTDSQI